jgi:lysophospholipid acyltransferase (LPLAT)-like uncharacterized protein
MPPGPLVRALAPPLAALLIRSTWTTNRITWVRRGTLESLLAEGPVVLAFWHSRLWLMPYAALGRPMTALISRHGDGELIARTIGLLGHGSARGSSTRGGSSALREQVRLLRAGRSVAITPDGPKGPARVAKPGAVELARMTGVPVVPVSAAYSRSRTFGSWDRFEVPLPFGRVAIGYGEPLRFPRDADVASSCERLAAALDAAGDDCRRALGDGR